MHHISDIIYALSNDGCICDATGVLCALRTEERKKWPGNEAGRRENANEYNAYVMLTSRLRARTVRARLAPALRCAAFLMRWLPSALGGLQPHNPTPPPPPPPPGSAPAIAGQVP